MMITRWKKPRPVQQAGGEGEESLSRLAQAPRRHQKQRDLFGREVEAATDFLVAHFALLGLLSEAGQEWAFRDLVREHLFSTLLTHEETLLALWAGRHCSFKLLFSTAPPQGNCLTFLAHVQVSPLKIRGIAPYWWYIELVRGKVCVSEAQVGEARAHIIYERLEGEKRR